MVLAQIGVMPPDPADIGALLPMPLLMPLKGLKS
jgi:hypothetical protein